MKPTTAHSAPPHATSSSTGASPSDAVTPLRRKELLSTGEMARLSKNTLRTVRFYEEEGILHPAGRTEGGHRLFPRTELDRLLLVSDLRMAGLSLEEIRRVLDVKRGAPSGAVAAASALGLLAGRIEELTSKIAVLVRLRDDLQHMTSLFGACVTCRENARFPDDCDRCEHLADVAPRPRSMRVLWNVGESAPAPSKG